MPLIECNKVKMFICLEIDLFHVCAGFSSQHKNIKFIAWIFWLHPVETEQYAVVFEVNRNSKRD